MKYVYLVEKYMEAGYGDYDSAWYDPVKAEERRKVFASCGYGTHVYKMRIEDSAEVNK